MPDYFVNVPFSNAQGWARACYNNLCTSPNGSPCMNFPANTCTACGGGQLCNNNLPCPHCFGINGLCCPGDIGGPANAAVTLIVSGGIKSARTTRTGPGAGNDGDGICTVAPPASFPWVNEGVKVNFYCGYDGHGSWIGTAFFGHLRNRIANSVYNLPYGLVVGYLGNIDCNCGCYRGIHAHVERSNANTGTTYAWTYNQPLNTGNWMFKWSIPNPIACV